MACCSRCRVPIRVLIAISVCMIMFSISDNMSITIVSMVDHMIPVNGSKAAGLCPPGNITHSKLQNLILRETRSTSHFPWSSEMQGIILGCYYWSFVLVLVPFGYISDKYGGAALLNTSILMSGILFLLTPIAASQSVWLLILIRTLLGMFQAAVNASSYVLMCRWLPVRERSFGLSLISTIGNVSTILFLLSAGSLIQLFSWEGMFYIPGIMCLVTFVIVGPIIRSEPETHSCIRTEEVAYIQGRNGIEEEEEEQDRLITSDENMVTCDSGVPWIRMLTNPAVVSLIFWKTFSSLSSFIITSEAPTYLSQVFDMDVGEIGHVSSLANSLYVTGCISIAPLSEYLIQKNFITRTRCRKVFSIFAGSCVAFTSLLSLARCDKELVISLLLTNYLMQSFYVATDLTLPAEMTNKYQGILFSIMNIASMSPGFMGPMYTGFVLQVIPDHWKAWDIILGSSAGILVLANVIFLIFTSAEIQSFDQEISIQSDEEQSSSSSSRAIQT